MNKPLSSWRQWRVVLFLALGILLILTTPSLGLSYGRGSQVEDWEYHQAILEWARKVHPGQDKRGVILAKERRRGRADDYGDREEKDWGYYEGLSPEEKSRLKKRYQKWKRYPPEKKKQLRRRMKRWRELSPEDQSRYRRRYHQWQSLSPEERERIRENLKRWNGLPPEDKEQIKERFRE